MSNPWVVTSATVILIALSAFFVAVEFALLAAKRHRLEDAASESRAARAALRSSTELTVLLAGSQLGITICTLALGAITKPAVHHWLTPAFASWGAPMWVADVAGFVLALMVVTFLHLVVGEMAPKSWAIAHPETSAIMLAIPMRAFMWATRPLLIWLNDMANWCLTKVGVEPTGQIASGRSPDDLRHLVEHSANVGALAASHHAQLTGALDLQTLTIGDLITKNQKPTQVALNATVRDIQNATRTTGHLRVLVSDQNAITGVVHVRDTLDRDENQPATDIMRPHFILEHTVPVYTALTRMRETRNHLAVVTVDGNVTGVVTLADVMARLFPVPSLAPAPAPAPALSDHVK